MGTTLSLHNACELGEIELVKQRLEISSQEDLEKVDIYGRTPLIIAVIAMKPWDISISTYQDSDTGDEFLQDQFPIHEIKVENIYQRYKQSPGTEKQLNSYEEDEIEEEDISIEIKAKDVEILFLLLQKQVNLDARDDNGWTALHHACFLRNALACEMLIRAGAKVLRDNYGLLPQDYLRRLHSTSPSIANMHLCRTQIYQWNHDAIELKQTLDAITPLSEYSIRLLAFRPSGVIELDLGDHVEQGKVVSIEFHAPESHSSKDYIQLLIFPDDDLSSMVLGSVTPVPAGSTGQIVISTDDIPISSTIRFVYVKSDINQISRQVVASGCNATVQTSVGEIFQYELYLYERLVEVETIPDFELLDQPVIVLKRIGMINDIKVATRKEKIDTLPIHDDDTDELEDSIDWVAIQPDNHIVAVNDIRIDTMDFVEAVRILQENNSLSCTKLLMQNYTACGDFIPEKIIGVGVIGKYAFLHSVKTLEGNEHLSGSEENNSTGLLKQDDTKQSKATSYRRRGSISVISSNGNPTVETTMSCEVRNTPEHFSTIETKAEYHSLQMLKQMQEGIATKSKIVK